MASTGVAEQGENEDRASSVESVYARRTGEEREYEIPLESGIPPPVKRRTPTERTLSDDADERLQLALVESLHADANLRLLLRGLSNLLAGAGSAREATAALTNELECLRETLGNRAVEEAALRRRVEVLEQTLDATRREAAAERAFFIEQEDRFIVELLADHEREMRELRHRVGGATTEPALPATMPPPPPSIGSAKTRTVRIPLPAPANEPRDLVPDEPHAAVPDEPYAFAGAPRAFVPDEPLPPLAASAISSELLIQREDERPTAPPPPNHAADVPPSYDFRLSPLKPKPDLSTRPLVEYSLGSDDVAEERLGKGD